MEDERWSRSPIIIKLIKNFVIKNFFHKVMVFVYLLILLH